MHGFQEIYHTSEIGNSNRKISNTPFSPLNTQLLAENLKVYVTFGLVKCMGWRLAMSQGYN